LKTRRLWFLRLCGLDGQAFQPGNNEIVFHVGDCFRSALIRLIDTVKL
jgi:hypothetical protein